MKRIIKWTFSLIVLFAALYGASRLYYRITDGFTIDNISSDYPYDPRWDVTVSDSELENVQRILAQPFNYLGKGCQSYVFLSQDTNYVLKFFKYQRFRPQQWLDYLTFLPGMDNYRKFKIEKKQKKLEKIFASWQVAFEDLKPETQLVYVHLNKSENLHGDLLIYDKLGFEHRLDPNQLEFSIQRKASMLCATIQELMAKGDEEGAKKLLTQTLDLIMYEYTRGYADNDHALMQNTGVYEGKPIHIDVGQLAKADDIKNPDIYRLELFSKTYRLREWLKKEFPQLLDDFELRLRCIIGSQFDSMQPYFKPHD